MDTDGQIRNMWVRVSPKYNEQKKLIRIFGVIRDITEQKRKEILTEVIYNISKAAFELDGEEELFKFIQNEIIRLIDASNMYVAYYNQEDDLLDIKYVTGEENIKHVPAEGTISKKVILENKPLLLTERMMDVMEANGEFTRIGRDSKCWMGVYPG